MTQTRTRAKPTIPKPDAARDRPFRRRSRYRLCARGRLGLRLVAHGMETAVTVLGRCDACGKPSAVYPATHYDAATKHFKAGHYCSPCLGAGYDDKTARSVDQESVPQPENA